MKPFLKICFVLVISALPCLCGTAQDSATLKAAKDEFAKGLELYTKKDYNSCINHLLACNRLVSKAVTYYFLCNAYCRVFDFQHAKDYAEAALNFNPPLVPKFVPDAKKIRDFAIEQLKPKETPEPSGGGVRVTASAIIRIPEGLIPAENENPYVNKKKTAVIKTNKKKTVIIKTMEYTPRQYSGGTAVIKRTFTFDLDNGREVSTLPQADLWWEYATSTLRYLVPQNGAKFHILPTSDFDAVDFAYLKTIPMNQYSNEKMPGFAQNTYSAFQLSPGIVIVFKTKEGRLGKMKIIQLDGDDLPIQWITYEK